MDVDSSEMNLNDLLHRAEQLTARIDGEIAIPRIDRNLKQLLNDGEKMWARTSENASKDVSDVQASVLLGSKGFDLQKVDQQLESLNSIKKPVEIEPVSYLDLNTFFRKNIEASLIQATEESDKSIIQLYRERIANHETKSWEQTKENILQSLINLTDSSSQSSPTNGMNSSKRKIYFSKPFLDTNSPTAMSSTEKAFAKEIIKYVDQKVNTTIKSDLTKAFDQVAQNTVGESAVISLWSMVSMLIAPDMPDIASKSALERRDNVELNSYFVRKACRFLEDTFVQTMQHVVNAPITDTIDDDTVFILVRDYLHIKTPYYGGDSSYMSSSFSASQPRTSNVNSDECVEGIPVFCFLFYCFRAGSLDAAVTVVEKMKKTPLKNELMNVLRDFKISNTGALSRNMEENLKLNYLRNVRLSTDCYKKAFFSVLARCAPEEFNPEMFDKYDDFLWMKLKKVSFDASTLAERIEHYGLEKLQAEILRLGPEYFDAQNRPLSYFRMLFLTMQWEAGIEFLFPLENYRCYAMHIAIALWENHLLNSVSPARTSLSGADVNGAPQVNFMNMIKTYTKNFEKTNTEEVVYYYYFLYQFNHLVDEPLFNRFVSDLVRTTKNYDTLLGYINQDGVRLPGVIDKFKFDVSRIIRKVAIDQQCNGSFEDAVLLFDLAGDHQKVLELLNKMLAPLVSRPRELDEKRVKIEDLAVKIANRYMCTQHLHVSKDVLTTFYLLIDLMTFFDYYHSQQFSSALETITNLSLFPFSMSEIVGKVSYLSKYTDEIRRNIPDLLLTTMDILCSQYRETKSTIAQVINSHGFVGDHSNKDKQLCELQEKGKCLITFAGMIPFRMPGDANAKLIQLQSSMT